jgi:hypothetical protein
MNPDEAMAHLIMGHLLAQDGARKEAIGHYEAVLRIRPASSPTVTPLLAKLRNGDDGQ